MVENQENLKMISFAIALKIIEKNVPISKKNEQISVDSSVNRILSSNLHSKCDYPRENLSAMDGAVIFKKDLNLKKIKIVGEIKASDIYSDDFNHGETKLIYTGGYVPGKEKVIIPKENFEILNSDNFLKIKKKKINDYIRKKGSDFKINELCLKKNKKISLRDISLAQTMKFQKIKVKKKPKVLVIVTGDELVTDNRKDPLVVSTNQFILKEIITSLGGEIINVLHSKDNIDDLEQLINKFDNFDLLISSGGISKGKYDLVKTVLKKKRLKILFDKVSIKPGKPTTFGMFSKKKFFLGLPGNPVSCLTSLIFFFSRFINSFYGQNYVNLIEENLILQNRLKKNNNFTNFLRIKIRKKKPPQFYVFPKQDSSQIKVLSDSDGIFIRKPFENEIPAGTKCKVLLFRNIFSGKI
mgnify:CR=1 FL=1|tara:strand:+ start:6872 stop:8107 length:1236 start_codon:yes stop_codon:yes gene_type:complete